MRISDWSSDVCSSDLPNPSGPAISGGGGTSAIWVTSPSAGATIRSAPVGVIRTGSRKKAPTQMVRPSISHGSTGQPSSQKQRVTIADRKSAGSGKRVSVRVDLGGSSIIKKTKKQKAKHET